MEVAIEKTVLSNLVFNEDYTRQVIPHLKPEYFHQKSDRVVYELIDKYVEKFNGTPTKEAVLIELKGVKGLQETEYQEAKRTVENLSTENTKTEWLIETTEKWCKAKSIYNAVHESINIISSTDGTKSEDSIPDILAAALAVAFDKRVGHDYFEDFEQRFEFYHRVDERLSFGIETLDKITKGGLPKKTLTVLMAPTGVGKSLIMCHLAAANVLEGKRVLYVTAEMAEERIAERLDANLLDVSLDDLMKMSHEEYASRMTRLMEKTVGRLIVKEYPTAAAHCGHIRACLREMKLKKNVVPDVIYVDYINIMASSRYKAGANVNSYTMIKSIAEELRGLAVEYNVPVITATQVNRCGLNNSDIEMSDTSESVGLPFTVDLMLGVMENEDLQALGQLMFKQLKNRLGPVDYYRRFVVGVDKSKMRLFDLGDKALEGVVKTISEDQEPVFDRTQAGKDSKVLKDKLKNLFVT